MPNNNLIITRRHGIAVGHCGHPIPETQAAPTVVSSRQKASLQEQAYQKGGHKDPGSKCDRKIRPTCKEVCREPRALGSVLTSPFASWVSLCFSLNLFVSTVGMTTHCDNSSQHFLSSVPLLMLIPPSEIASSFPHSFLLKFNPHFKFPVQMLSLPRAFLASPSVISGLFLLRDVVKHDPVANSIFWADMKFSS